jgi:hypothetical protein
LQSLENPRQLRIEAVSRLGDPQYIHVFLTCS